MQRENLVRGVSKNELSDPWQGESEMDSVEEKNLDGVIREEVKS